MKETITTAQLLELLNDIRPALIKAIAIIANNQELSAQMPFHDIEDRLVSAAWMLKHNKLRSVYCENAEQIRAEVLSYQLAISDSTCCHLSKSEWRNMALREGDTAGHAFSKAILEFGDKKIEERKKELGATQ